MTLFWGQKLTICCWLLDENFLFIFCLHFLLPLQMAPVHWRSWVETQSRNIFLHFKLQTAAVLNHGTEITPAKCPAAAAIHSCDT